MFSKLWGVEWNSHLLILPRICFKLFSSSKVYHIRKSRKKLSLSNIAQNFFLKGLPDHEESKSNTLGIVLQHPSHLRWCFQWLYCDNSFDWFGDIRSKMLAEMGFYFVQQYRIFMRSFFFLQNHHEMSKLLMQIISVIEHWPSILIISVPR